MYQSPDFPVTSLKALSKTIRHDGQVCRWFRYLVMHKELRGELASNQRVKTAYKWFSLISVVESVIYCLLIGLLYLIVWGKTVMLGALAIVLVGIGISLNFVKRELTARICSVLFERDFIPAAFSQKTLYQIGEFYAKKYGVTPLVNAITSSDAIVRSIVLGTIIFVIFIRQMNFWLMWGAIFAAYYVTHGLISPTFVYKRLK